MEKNQVESAGTKYVPTEKQIEDWKKKHGDVFAYEADDYACYLKRPDRKTISAAAALGTEDPVKYAEVLLRNCWLGGNAELRDEDKYFFGLQKQVGELVEIKTGILKKL